MAAELRGRAARESDYELFCRLFGELGVDDPLPDERRWSAEFAPTTVVIEGGGGSVGIGYYSVYGELGHVRHVIVAPEFRRQGAGRAVMEAVAAALRGAGCARWCLNVKRDNAGAIGLYERYGMAVSYRSAALRVRWAVIPRLPAFERPLAVVEVDPAVDAAVERAYGLPAGQLAVFRTRRTNVLLQVVDRDHPTQEGLGVARLSRMPGAFPFKARDSTAARALLEAIRERLVITNPSATASLLVVIEDDDTLDAALRAAGAEVVHEMFHMDGALPASS